VCEILEKLFSARLFSELEKVRPVRKGSDTPTSVTLLPVQIGSLTAASPHDLHNQGMNVQLSQVFWVGGIGSSPSL